MQNKEKRKKKTKKKEQNKEKTKKNPHALMIYHWHLRLARTEKSTFSANVIKIHFSFPEITFGFDIELSWSYHKRYKNNICYYVLGQKVLGNEISNLRIRYRFPVLFTSSPKRYL